MKGSGLRVAGSAPIPTSHPPMSSLPERFSEVSVLTKANVYFDGGVISHTVLFPDGSKKTLGIIRPGDYHFGTGVAERMEIVDGMCQVRLDGSDTEHSHATGSHFDVPAKSGFSISVDSGVCQYICSFLD